MTQYLTFIMVVKCMVAAVASVAVPKTTKINFLKTKATVPITTT